MAMDPGRRLGKRGDRGSWSASLSARLRGLLDRFANADIGPAAADVAGHRAVDVGIRRKRIGREERRSRHDLARLAVAALNDLPVEPRLLNLGACHCRADGLDCCDLGCADAVERSDTGTDGDTVEMHGAGAAERHAAAELRAGHAEHIAQHPQERGVAVNIDRPIDAVDLDRGGHRYLHTIRGSDAKTSFRWHSRGTAQLACGPSGSYAAPCERSWPGRLQCLAPPHQVVEHGLTALHEIGVIIQGATALDDPKIWLH